MPTIVRMPQLGESVAEGTIGRWLKKPGDRVERDEPLVEVLTDKVNAEVPSPVSGVLQQILTDEGTTVPVKTDIAVIVGESEEGVARGEVPAPAQTVSEVPALGRSFSFDETPGGGPTSSARVAAHDPDARVRGPSAGETRRFYTPVVLRMAQEHRLDLESISGTGLGGRVTRRDVERALGTGVATPAAPMLVPSAPSAEQPAHRPSAGADLQPLTPMRRAIAQHVTRARAEIPDAWCMVEVDVTRLARRRDGLQAEWQAREGFELTYLPFFVKAVLTGLQEVPELNAGWQDERIALHRQRNLGIAVSVDQGLVVPVLRNADQLSLAGLARTLRQVVQAARAGKLTTEDLQDATFTVNNPGALGSVLSQPIVPLGQAGIVTMEAVVKRPVVTQDDAIAVRSMMNCCLSFDHRILDGSQALAFLGTVKQQLETVDYPLY